MIRINLLPAEIKPIRSTARQYLLVYILCVLVTGMAIAFLWFSQARTIDRLQRRESELEAEASRYAQYEKILQALTKQKEIIEKKKELIRGLAKDRDKMARILALLSLWVPADKVWFETLTITGDKIDVAGMALSNESIAEFMRNIEQSPFAVRGSVVLAHSKQASVGQRKLREYRLTWSMVPYSRVKESLARKDQAQSPEDVRKSAPQTTPQKKPQG